MRHRMIPLLAPIVILTTIGCSKDQRLADMAERNLQRQDDQNRRMAELQDEVAQGAREPVARADRDDIRSRIDSLTRREREVMGLVVEGKANKNIARDLGISQQTVEIHRARVMEKMEVRSVPRLVQLVMMAGEGET